MRVDMIPDDAQATSVTSPFPGKIVILTMKKKETYDT